MPFRTPRGLFLFVATLLLLAGAAGALAAAPGGVNVAPDGTVTAGGQVFKTMKEFHQSAYFREHGLRCGTKFPEKGPHDAVSATSDCSYNHTVIRPEYWPAREYRIPVAFHVIIDSDGVTGNISDARIAAQIQVLNEDFQALAGTMGANGYNTRVQFYLAGITRTVQADWFKDYFEADFKRALLWDLKKYLNIYTNNTVHLGYSYLPDWHAGMLRDGVVLNHATVGGRNNGYLSYNQGRTAVHEVGHYLGLHHTFHGGCANSYSSGDYLVDTPAEEYEHYTCSQTYTCGSPDPIHNYMDYTNDSCMYQFSPEQANRIICSLINYRPDLVGIAPVVPTPTATPTPTPTPSPTPTPPPQIPWQPVGWIPMYRTYNPNLYYHFYTTSYPEFVNAVQHGYNDESTGSHTLFYVQKDPLLWYVPLHRLYSPGSGRHYYTFRNAEVQALVALGWNKEHDEGYVYTQLMGGATEIYRLYNTVFGTHLYTASVNEVIWILNNLPDWQQHQSLGFALVPTNPLRPSQVDRENLARLAAAQGVELPADGEIAGFPSSPTQPGWVLTPVATPPAGPQGSGRASDRPSGAANDFNQDGNSDLLWCDPATGEAMIWLMEGETLLEKVALGRLADPAWAPLMVADLNNDGWPDVVWQHGEDRRVAVWLMQGTRPTTKAVLGSLPDAGWTLYAHGDYDGDGREDLVWSGAEGKLTIWLMEGTRVRAVRELPPAPARGAESR
ncbi:MAG: VCBS repeat-containing protein [Deltaproteobacteria bacterium]|nr:VCBS repeat-containing protein [Deltaproteobacteria bacterium]